MDGDRRVALITGAAGGLGEAMARCLAREGGGLILVDRDLTRCEAVAAELRNTDVMALQCDVTIQADVHTAVEHGLQHFGRLDILVNNAGVLRDDLLFRMTDDDWDTVLAVHLRGAFLFTRAVQRSMVARRWGRIINVSSLAALGNRGQANYAAAKAGLIGFTRTVALELGEYGITANAIAPGFIDTAMTRGLASRLGLTFDQLEAQWSPHLALRRFGRPEEVAGVVAFLASEDSSYVTGQTIYVAGSPAGGLP